MFSNLLDITGFFVSVLINLLLIALICYYFKRKIDNLEYSQSEQAKTLYTLISQQNNMMAVNNETNTIITGANDIMSGLDLTQLNQTSDDENKVVADDDSDSYVNDEESEEEDDDESLMEEGSESDNKIGEKNQTIHMVSVEEDVKQIEFNDQSEELQEETNEFSEESLMTNQDNNQESEVVEPTNDEEAPGDIENYEKMTVKELRNVLAEKGVHAKSSMNKSDIINILKGASNIDLEMEHGNTE